MSRHLRKQQHLSDSVLGLGPLVPLWDVLLGLRPRHMTDAGGFLCTFGVETEKLWKTHLSDLKNAAAFIG